MSRQKGKGMKRRKSWHRGGIAARIQTRKLNRLPHVADDVDYTQAAPTPFKRNHPPGRGHGDAA